MGPSALLESITKITDQQVIVKQIKVGFYTVIPYTLLGSTCTYTYTSMYALSIA